MDPRLRKLRATTRELEERVAELTDANMRLLEAYRLLREALMAADDQRARRIETRCASH